MTRRTLLAASLAPLAAQELRPIRIGIIGLGNRSRNHLDGLKLHRADAPITALCDLDSSRAARVNAALPESAATYTDYRELLADRNVDAVVIVSPNFLHREMALAALKAGKDVLVEKPLALTYDAAREVAAEASRLGRVLAVGMQRRYFPADARIRQLVEEGRIGAIHFISYNEFRGDWNPNSWKFSDPVTGAETNWRYLRKTAGSSELELSIHSFGFVQSLLNSSLVKLSASGGTVHFKGRETRDLSTAIADFSNGARLEYSFCGFAPGAWHNCNILGEKGALELHDNRLVIRSTGAKPETEEFRAAESAESQMYREFFRSVRDRTPSPLNAQFAIEASKLAYAIDIAIIENRAVTAADFTPRA